jgi:chromate reductase, NAD(P)H dehydrogenase (quinone)
MAMLPDKTNILGSPIPARFLAFSASLRGGSLNTPLERLAARVIEQHGGTVDLASMELKNVIDWASRYKPQPLNDRHALLMSASPSMAGGNRGLWSLRVPLEHLGARVVADMFSLATAHQALSPESENINPILSSRFVNNLVAFMSLVEAAKHYPCMKRPGWDFSVRNLTLRRSGLNSSREESDRYP